jgi:serine/threonine protein kinase
MKVNRDDAQDNTDDDAKAKRLEEIHCQLVSPFAASEPIGKPLFDDPELASAEYVLRMIEQVRRGNTESPTSRSLANTPGFEVEETAEVRTESQRKSNDSAGDARVDWFQSNLENQEPHSLPRSIGRFEIVKLLGRGGFGLVFLANDPRLDRQVALKIPRLDALMTGQLTDRFIREAKAAALLSHPNIVTVFDAGFLGPAVFVASQYVPGRNLSQWLAENSRVLAPADSALIIAALASAVQHAHSRGVIHRDLKPSNVLVEEVEEAASLSSEQVKITDFGLARIVTSAEQATPSHTTLGTPMYMAPEQSCGETNRVGPAADVYGLGAIFYELLTAKPPHLKPTLAATLRAVELEEPVAPRRINRAVPQDLEAICLKCLEKQPSRRYPSAYELQLDLQRFLEGQPVLARPLSSGRRMLRWSRRNPVLSLVSSAAILFLVISLIASYVGWVSTSQALSAARLANEATLAAQRESDQRFLAAKRTVDEYFTQIATNRLLNIPGLTPLRHELLQAALHYYQGFLEQTADDDELLAEIERAHFRLGEILVELGQPTEALEHFQHSERLLIQLLDSDPTDLPRQQLLNGTCSKIASQQMVLGNAADALATLEQAIQRQQQLFLAQPDSPTVAGEMAAYWQQQGNFLRGMRQPNEAHELFEKVIGLREQLLADDENNDELRRELLNSQGNLANTLRAMGKLPEALQLSNQVVTRLREIASRPNSTPVDRHTLLKSLYNSSLLSLMVRDFATASQTLEEAAGIADNLARVFPAVEAHLRDPALMRGALAVAYLELGEIEQALENFRLNEQGFARVVELNPDSVDNLIDAGLAKLNYGAALGNHAKDYLAAEKMIESAQQLLQQVLDLNPASFNARMGAANCEINLAAFAVELEEWDLAVDRSQRGLELTLVLREEHSRNPQLRHAISQAYTNLANGQENLFRFEESVSAWQNVLEWTFPQPDHLQRLRLSAALILNGQLAEAQEQLGLVDGQLGERSNRWMQQGRCFALFARALHELSVSDGVDRQSAIEDHCQQAITSLARARDLGQFESPKWRDYLENSADLDALRPRIEFQALLIEN